VSGGRWAGAEVSATTYALRLEGVATLEVGVSAVKTKAPNSPSRSPSTFGVAAMTGSYMLYQIPKTSFRVGLVYPELAARLISNFDDWPLLNLSVTLPAVRVSFWRALVDVRFGELAFDVQFEGSGGRASAARA
jgi:hypothetical protein